MRYCNFLFLIVLASSVTLIAETQIPDKALCSVCALKGGETELEKVKAHSEHDGKAYYFCSKNCKIELAISSLRLDLSLCLCYIYSMRKGVY